MKTQPSSVTILAVGNSVRIYIKEHLHLAFKQSEFVGLQSWIESTNLFCIEIYLRTTTIKTEYDDAARWKSILLLLDETL